MPFAKLSQLWRRFSLPVLLTLFCLTATGVVVYMMARDVYRLTFYVPVMAQITAVAGPDYLAPEKEHERGHVAFTYNFWGRTYKGTWPTEEDQHVPDFQPLTFRLGDAFPIRVEPRHGTPHIGPMTVNFAPLAIFLILVPLGFLCINQWRAAFQPGKKFPETDTNSVAFGFVYGVTSVACTVGCFMFFSSVQGVPWWAAVIIIAFALVLTWWAGLLASRWVRRPRANLKKAQQYPMKEARRKLLVGGGFGLVLVCVTLPLVHLGASNVLEWIQARNYAQGEATILRQAEVRRRSGKRSSFNFRVEYAFVVDGKTFTSHRLTYDGHSITSQNERAIYRAKFFEGARVPVYYDPADPQRSLLLRELPFYFPLILFFVAIFPTLGVWIMFAVWREWRQAKSTL